MSLSISASKPAPNHLPLTFHAWVFVNRCPMSQSSAGQAVRCMDPIGPMNRRLLTALCGAYRTVFSSLTSMKSGVGGVRLSAACGTISSMMS